MAKTTLKDLVSSSREAEALLRDPNLGHQACANQLSYTFQTCINEQSVRRWRRKHTNIQVSPYPPRIPTPRVRVPQLVQEIAAEFDQDDLRTVTVEAKGGHFDDKDRAELHKRLDETLDKVNIDASTVRGLRVAQWDGMIKDIDNKMETRKLYGVKLLVQTRDPRPAWPVVQQAPQSVINVKFTPKLPVPSDWKIAVILPDIQAGYYRLPDDSLISLHDLSAIDVALQITVNVCPDIVLIGGDGADLAEFGKYRLSPAFARTTQATVNWVEQFIATLRACLPETKIVWLEGNHEARISNFVLDNAKAAYGLKQAGVPDSWPVMSLPHLARFDTHDVTYLPGYPACEYWFNDRIVARHGDRVNSAGSTVHRYLNTERVSTITFHIHRVEYGSRTRHTRYGPRTIIAASPGCLCKLTGAVPSMKGGIDSEGLPLARSEDWQQGMAVLHYREGDAEFVYESIYINDGKAMFHGNEYLAREM